MSEISSESEPHRREAEPRLGSELEPTEAQPSVVTADTQTLRAVVLPPEAMSRYEVIAASQRLHIGPLPPPEDYAAYESVHAGAAGRILTMAEREQAHGQEMDRQALAAIQQLGTRGQRYALTSTLALGAMGFILGTLGHQAASVAFGVTALVPVTLAFLGRSNAEKPRGETKPGEAKAAESKSLSTAPRADE